MSQTALLYVMASFVIISAIALCIQAGMLAGIYKTVKTLQEKIDPLVPKVESLVEKTNSTVEISNKQISEITSRTIDILDSTKRQMAIVEDVVGDVAGRAKVQIERVELVVDDTLSRAHEVVAVFHDGVMKPLREINGLAAGIRAGLATIARGNRPTPDQATSDEEMFI
jgi:hypothetical protein